MNPLRFMLCVAVALMVLAVPASGAPGDAIYTHAGKIVDVRGRGIDFHCIGTGAPVVVFDAGWEDWSPAWAVVQPRIARFTRACSYDRAGSGFSDPGLMPRTSVRIADELHAALHAAAIAGPYVLVGHSFGSYNIRTFADRYMNEVAGMVIVDGENGDVEPPAQRRLDDEGLAAAVKPLQRCRAAIVAAEPLPYLHGTRGEKPLRCDRVFFRGLPERNWSPQLNAAILRFVSRTPTLYDAVISELQGMPADEVYLQTHVRSLGARPLRVLTAMQHFGPLSRLTPKQRVEAAAFERINARSQAKWLRLSGDAKQIFARRSSHYIQYDQPDIVVNAVRDVVARIRRRTGQ